GTISKIGKLAELFVEAIMSKAVDRRGFGKALLASAVGFGHAGNWAFAKPTDDDREWVVPVLGDLHFDRLEHHDMDWLRERHPGDVSQVQNYSRISSDLMPRLLPAVRHQAARETAPLPFVLQLGDLVEGLCGTEALARRQA